VGAKILAEGVGFWEELGLMREGLAWRRGKEGGEEKRRRRAEGEELYEGVGCQKVSPSLPLSLPRSPTIMCRNSQRAPALQTL